jgi:crotonobetaine/carnitine-CoA ligase
MDERMISRRNTSGVENLIRARFAEAPDEVWLYFKESTFTWRDVISNAERVANGLLRLGIKPGEYVAIMAGNKPEFLWVYFGLLMIGVQVVPLNRWQRGMALRHMLNDSGSAAIIFDDELKDPIFEVRDSCPALRLMVTFGVLSEGIDANYDFLIAGSDGEPDVAVEIPSRPAGILYTSGTTGPPKGIVSESYGDHLSPLLQASCIEPGETMYACLPLIHGNALFVSALGSIRLRAKLALAERFSASRFWDDCRRYNAVQVSTLGGIIPLLMKQPPRPNDRDNPVRIALSVGCPAATWEEFQKRFDVRVVEWYGMSDAPGNLINTQGKIGSVGKPAGDAEFIVADDNDALLPPGKRGQLLFRHPAGRVTRYNNLPDVTDDSYRGGWFHSGDLAEMDAEGFFYFRGRMKEAIRRRGENISAWEVESVVDQHPMVRESAAFGLPSELGDEEVAIAVVLQPGAALAPKALLSYCEGRLAYYAMPRFIEFVDDLPKTGTQKIQKNVLKQRGVTAKTWDREAAGVLLAKV